VRLEFSVPGRIDRAAFLDMGDGRYIEVFSQAATMLASEGRRRRPDEEPTEGALLHFCFRVDDVEAAYSRALSAGAVARVRLRPPRRWWVERWPSSQGRMAR